MKILTEEDIDEISEKYIALCGDYALDEAILTKDIVSFAREIEKTVIDKLKEIREQNRIKTMNEARELLRSLG